MICLDVAGSFPPGLDLPSPVAGAAGAVAEADGEAGSTSTNEDVVAWGPSTPVVEAGTNSVGDEAAGCSGTSEEPSGDVPWFNLSDE